MNRTHQSTKTPFSRRLLMASTALMAASAIGFSSSAALAVDNLETPQGGNVTGGAASISNPSAGRLEIDQSTDRVFIDWDSFNIGEGASTEFFQPGTGSLAVNKVVGAGQDPSQILGSLKSNGNVMILDRNGVFFGRNATIDVGGIIASTGDINEDALKNGADVIEFTNLGDGTIENQAQISVAQAGIAAFVAPTVKNSGVINAKLGKVAFAAGSKVTLDLYGDQLVEIEAGDKLETALLENSGTINAEGGVVQMTARAANDAVDSVINMSGVINASSVTQKGGKIILGGGDNGLVKVSGKIDASGTSGGSVEATGQNVYQTNTSEISVASTDTVNGTAGSATFNGTDNGVYDGVISAEGQNGFIETSGGNLAVRGNVILGQGGNWLLDPTDLVIVGTDTTGGDASATDLSQDPFSPEDSVANPSGGGVGNADSIFWIYDQLINNALNSGASVRLQTNAGGANEGDITLRADAHIMKTAGVDSTLTLEAHDDIIIDGTIGASGAGSLSVSLVADFDGSGGDSDVIINNTIKTNGGFFGATAADNIDVNAEIDAEGTGFITFSAPTINLAADVKTDGFIDGTASIVNVQNDTAQINDGVKVGAEGATINVAAGTYNESVEAFKADQTLKGANAGVAGFGERGAESTISPNSPGILVTADGVTVDGFEIDGGEIGVHVMGATDVKITNNYIHGQRHPEATGTQEGFRGSGDGILVSHAANNVHITRNTVEDTDDEAVQAVDSRNILLDLNLLDNRDTADANGHEAVNFTNISGDSRINGNEIYTGFYSGVGIYDSEGVLVDANMVKGRGVDADDYGIQLTNSTNSLVGGNIISSVGKSAVYVNGSDDTSVFGNSISETGESGILINPSLNALVEGNIINNTGSHGIEVLESDNATVSGNDIGLTGGDNNINGDGIHIVDSSNAVVQRNMISNTTSTAVDIGSGIHIINSDNALIGSYNDYEENIIFNTAWDGVRVYNSDNVQVIGNDIDDVERSGVFGGVVDNFTVAENDIDGAAQDHGVHVSFGSNIAVTNNKIANVNLDGVLVHNFDVAWISDNTINMTGDDGIDAHEGGYTSIYGNTIFGAGFHADNADEYGADGIHVRNVGGYLGAPLAKGDGVGFAFSGADSDIYENNIAFTKHDGVNVMVDTLLGANTYVYNNIIGHVGYDVEEANGIFVTQLLESEIYGNKVTSVLSDGIKVKDGFYTGIYNNRLALIGEDGIEVSNVSGGRLGGPETMFLVGPVPGEYTGAGSVEITNNEVAVTGENGIYVRNSGATRIINNDVYMAGVGDAVAEEVNMVGAFIAGDFAPVHASAVSLLADVVDETPSFDLYWSDGDGILVENVHDRYYDVSVTNAGIGSGYDSESYAVVIQGNEVEYTGGDGIEVFDAGRTLIGGDGEGEGNVVIQAGIEQTTIEGANSFSELFTSGPFEAGAGRQNLWTENVEGSDTDDAWLNVPLASIIGDHVALDEIEHDAHDGIKVGFVFKETSDVPDVWTVASEGVYTAGDNGSSYVGYAVDILNNIVLKTGDDGIEVTNSSSTLIKNNVVLETGYGFGEDYGSGDYFGADGIYVANISGEQGYNNDVFNVANLGGISSGDGFVNYAVVIDRNIVLDTADDGIEVVGGYDDYRDDRSLVKNIFGPTGRTLITNNIVDSAGNGVGAEDGFGSDGVHVRGVFANQYNDYPKDVLLSTQQAGAAGGYGHSDYAVQIIGNDIITVDDDGIEVLNSESAYIADNLVFDAGVPSEGSYYGGYMQNAGADGITVRGVGQDYYGGPVPRAASSLIGGNDGNGFYGYAVEIIGNDIQTTGDDGIEVSNSHSTLIDGNEIYNAGSGGDDYYGGGDFYGADGIHVRNVSGGRSYGPGLITEQGFEDYAVVIRNNFIDDTADDGIEVISDYEDSYYNDVLRVNLVSKDFYGPSITGRTLIEGNETYNNGVFANGDIENELQFASFAVSEVPYYGAPDGYGADGIHVRGVADNVYVETYSEDEQSETFTYTNGERDAVIIRDNIVDVTGDDGIEVLFSGRTNIADNTISHSGYGGGLSYGVADEMGGDGIHVAGVIANTSIETDTYTEENGYEYDYDYIQNSGTSVTITGNNIDVTGDDGIQVLDSGNSIISNNIVTNVGQNDGDAFTIDGNQSDGIHVRTGLLGDYYYGGVNQKTSFISDVKEGPSYYFLSTSTLISGNTVNNVSDDGIDVEGVTDVTISNNTVSNVGDDGIDVVGYAGAEEEFDLSTIEFGNSEGPTLELPTFTVNVTGNNVTNSADNGIAIENADFITVSNNNVANSNAVGVLISDDHNGSVVLSGNTLTNNAVHARFESGQVDLTGAGNNFVNGGTGIQFDGGLVSLIDNDPSDEYQGTLGAQTFNGQSGFYVELTNGALFEPGQPALYNALNSTYVGPDGAFTPSDTGGILTVAQLDFLEGKFQHFVDLDTLGLFFFGALSLENVEDFLNTFGQFNGDTTGARVTITALPFISQTQSALQLNNLTPAAGEDGSIPGDINGDGELSAEEAAALDPAAGAEEVGCWSDAQNVAEGGVSVTYDFDNSPESAIADAAGCGIAQAQ